MLRPKGMDAQIGPFFDITAFEAVLSEMGRLAIQVGEHLDGFMPDPLGKSLVLRYGFLLVKRRWIKRFYSDAGPS